MSAESAEEACDAAPGWQLEEATWLAAFILGLSRSCLAEMKEEHTQEYCRPHKSSTCKTVPWSNACAPPTLAAVLKCSQAFSEFSAESGDLTLCETAQEQAQEEPSWRRLSTPLSRRAQRGSTWGMQAERLQRLLWEASSGKSMEHTWSWRLRQPCNSWLKFCG